MSVTVALVEDDAAMRQRICSVVAAEPSLSLLFAASRAEELLPWYSTHLVDVLLVDLGLPDMSGLEVIERCCALQPECSVMVLTMFGDESNMLRAFEAGARGYLLKDGTESDLARHVLSLHAGGSPMTPVIARRLLTLWQSALPRHGSSPTLEMPALVESPGLPLSRRESQVLDLISRGFTYAEIGAQMAVSVSTVQTHVRNIYVKLGVHSKTEAVFEARQSGLLR